MTAKAESDSINLFIDERFLYMKTKTNRGIRPIQILPLGFLLIIGIGTVLLMLPISTKSGSLRLFDAIFTATSASCVTGLTVVDTLGYFTSFGHVILLLLIQIGGLGFMTMTTFLFIIMRRQLSLRNRIILKEALGEESPVSAQKVMWSAVKYTFAIEGVGAILLATRFVPRFGLGKGVWYGVFHSVSAFCNAGFDLMGAEGSLQFYVGDPIVNVTIILLIILGGTGFAVIHNVLAYRKHRRLMMQTKIVLVATGFLIIAGAVLFFTFEYNNPATMGNLSVGDKMWAALFQSVTCRTAGFFSMDQAGMQDASKLLSCILMFIGAAPGGTAGGIKVTTIMVILLTIRALVQGKEDVEAFQRRIEISTVRRALCLFIFALGVLMLAILTTSIAENGISMIDLAYELCSALGTVGLTNGVTASAGMLTKVVLCIFMYFGRVGLMTLVVSLGREERRTIVRYPSGNIMIG